MKSYDEILRLIDLAQIETLKIAGSSPYFAINKDPLLTTREMLDWLKKELIQGPEILNPDLVRRFKKQGIAAFKEYENTPLESCLCKIIDLL